MIEWLQNFGGYTSTGLTIDEKKELESLRLQVKKYRAMEEGKENKDENQSESDDEDDVDPELDNIVTKINTNPQMKKMSLIPRSGVSAEVYGQFHKKESFVAKIVPKSQEQIRRIKSSVIHSFLFGNLEQKDLEVVINAMEEKNIIIKVNKKKNKEKIIEEKVEEKKEDENNKEEKEEKDTKNEDIIKEEKITKDEEVKDEKEMKIQNLFIKL